MSAGSDRCNVAYQQNMVLRLEPLRAAIMIRYLDLGSNDAYCSCQLRTNQYDEFASYCVLAVASWRSITVSADTFKIIGYCHQISQFTCGRRQHGAMLLLKNSIAS